MQYSNRSTLGNLDIKAQLILRTLLPPIIFVPMDIMSSMNRSLSRLAPGHLSSLHHIAILSFLPFLASPSHSQNLFQFQTFEKRRIFYPSGIQNIIPAISGKVIPWERPRCASRFLADFSVRQGWPMIEIHCLPAWTVESSRKPGFI